MFSTRSERRDCRKAKIRRSFRRHIDFAARAALDTRRHLLGGIYESCVRVGRRHRGSACAVLFVTSPRVRRDARRVPADAAKFAADHETCRTLVAQGVRSGFGSRLASGGVGVATGVGVTAAAVGGTASSGALGAAAAASAATLILPVVGIMTAWGMAKARKSKKERDVKKAMSLCLSEQGYEVGEWKVAPKRK